MSQKRVFNTNAEHIYVNDVPEYNLDLVNARGIDPAYSFTRNSAGTYVGPDGYIKTAAANQPRFDYDPLTGEYKGLLIEESRTNYFRASNDLANTTYWQQDATSISLDGTNNRGNYYKIRGTNGNYRGLVSNFHVWGIYPGASATVTLSMDAKVPDDESGTRLLSFTVIATLGNTGGFVDISFATVSNTSTSGIDLGNGWRRYSGTYTWMSSWSGTPFVKINPRFSTSQNVLIANLQLERGSYLTSYIPTTTSTVTRQPDQLVLNKTLNTQGTFFIESNPTRGIPLVADNGSSSLSIGQPTNQYTKSVLYYNNNRTLRMASDNSVPSDYIYTNPQDLNRISLGFDKTTNSNYINGHLKKFSYYSSPLSEDNLRALTGNKVSAFRNDIIQDEDASAYIQLVEFADGQPLEPEVKLAIERFIVGCKTDGIWDAIKASCILAGARTLSGALVPLVGAAPTNYKFTSSRYNRKFGISGSSGMYIDSNRPGNLDPRNSKHFSVYVTNSSNTSGQSRMGHRSSSNLSQIYRGGLSLLELAMSGPNINYSVPRNELGFVAIQRISDTIQQARGGGSTNTQTTSTALNQPALNTYVFAMNNNGLTTNYSTDRLSFYSIGESLDLAKLDSRVTTLMNEISAALP